MLVSPPNQAPTYKAHPVSLRFLTCVACGLLIAAGSRMEPGPVMAGGYGAPVMPVDPGYGHGGGGGGYGAGGVLRMRGLPYSASEMDIRVSERGSRGRGS
jgi:hypothetical protein